MVRTLFPLTFLIFGCGAASEEIFTGENEVTPSISGNWGHVCLIEGTGRLFCFGFDFTRSEGAHYIDTPREAPGGPYKAVSTGIWHTCAIRTTGELYCWGKNNAGQLGLGDQLDRAEPTQVGTSNTWEKIGVGSGTSCGIQQGGVMYCWGGVWLGQEVTPEQAVDTLPLQIAGSFVETAAHFYAHCAIRDDGVVMCKETIDWNVRGTFELTGLSGAHKVTTAIDSICAATDGGIRCNAMRPDRGDAFGFPTELPGEYAELSGTYHLCAIRTDGTMRCGGRNEDGQLGGGDRSGEPEVVENVAGRSDWAAVTTGADYTCALTRDVKLYCFGARRSHLFGPNTDGVAPYPVEIAR